MSIQAGQPDLFHDRGFTLMELLVAMTLLGILMATLLGGLRLGSRVWDVSERAVQQVDEVEIVRNFLRERFERILPLSSTISGEPTETLFMGDQRRLRFVSFMPESFNNQPFLLELSLQQRGGGGVQKDLVLTWRRLEGDQPELGQAAAGERVLIEDVAEIAFGYFGGDRRQAKAWFEQWSNSEFLPSLIKFELGFLESDQRRWPPLMVSPMINDWYDTSS